MAIEKVFIDENGELEITGRLNDNGRLEIEIRECRHRDNSKCIELAGSDMREFIDEMGKQAGYCKATNERF